MKLEIVILPSTEAPLKCTLAPDSFTPTMAEYIIKKMDIISINLMA